MTIKSESVEGFAAIDRSLKYARKQTVEFWDEKPPLTFMHRSTRMTAAAHQD